MIRPLERRVGELSCMEICAGAGGQALGLEQAGFAHAAAVEIDADACETLSRNRGSRWKIIEADAGEVDGTEFRGVDLLAGGVPCPAVLGRRAAAGPADERAWRAAAAAAARARRAQAAVGGGFPLAGAVGGAAADGGSVPGRPDVRGGLAGRGVVG